MTTLLLFLACAPSEAEAPAPSRPALGIVLDLTESTHACGGKPCETRVLPEIWQAFTERVGVKPGLSVRAWLVGGGPAPFFSAEARKDELSGPGNARRKRATVSARIAREIAGVHVEPINESRVIETITVAARQLQDTHSDAPVLVIVSDLLDCFPQGKSECGWFLRSDNPGQTLIDSRVKQGGLPHLEGAAVIACGVYPSHASAEVGLEGGAYFEKVAPAFTTFFEASGATDVHVTQACDALSVRSAFTQLTFTEEE